jgi:ribosomal protein S18 acetylase RimI-like enzyme
MNDQPIARRSGAKTSLRDQLRDAARRAANTYSRYGIFTLLHALVVRLIRRILGIDIFNVLWINAGALAVPSQNDPEMTFRWLTDDEVRRFAADPSNDLDPKLAGRIAEGTRFCLAALKDDRLAGYCNYALDSLTIAYVRNAKTRISYSHGLAHVYNGFTYPEFRGRRLLETNMRLAAQELARHNIGELFALVEWTNWPSLRVFQRMGYRRLYRFVSIPIAGRTVLVIGPKAERHLLRFEMEGAVARKFLGFQVLVSPKRQSGSTFAAPAARHTEGEELGSG